MQEDKVIEILEENSSEETQRGEKTKEPSKMRAFVGKAASKVMDVGAKAVDAVGKKKDEMLESLERKKVFENKTYLYEILGSKDFIGKPKTIRAFRDVNEDRLLVPLNESNYSIIKTQAILKNSEDGSVVTVKYVEMKNPIIHKLLINDDKIEDIPCAVVKYEDKKEEIKQNVIINTSTQTVNVHGDMSGEINQVSNIENELNEILDKVVAAKPKGLARGKKEYEEAIKIIGPVRETIISGERNKTLLERFAKLLEVFAPALLTIFMQLSGLS